MYLRVLWEKVKKTQGKLWGNNAQGLHRVDQNKRHILKKLKKFQVEEWHIGGHAIAKDHMERIDPKWDWKRIAVSGSRLGITHDPGVPTGVIPRVEALSLYKLARKHKAENCWSGSLDQS